jgi:hypothetical protein
MRFTNLRVDGSQRQPAPLRPLRLRTHPGDRRLGTRRTSRAVSSMSPFSMDSSTGTGRPFCVSVRACRRSNVKARSQVEELLFERKRRHDGDSLHRFTSNKQRSRLPTPTRSRASLPGGYRLPE